MPIKSEPPEPEGVVIEVRPVPIDTVDVLQQRLYAVHQDHTYHLSSLNAKELHNLQASALKTEKSSNPFIHYSQNREYSKAKSKFFNK